MRLSCGIILLFLVATRGFAEAITMVPKHPKVVSGEGFLIRLRLGPQFTPQQLQCNRNNKLPFLNPGTTVTLETGEVLQRVDFADSEIGLRVFNTTSESGGVWELIATDSQGFKRMDTAYVEIQEVDIECVREPSQCDRMPLHGLNCEADKCAVWTDGKMSKKEIYMQHNFVSEEVGTAKETTTGSTILECNAVDHFEINECFIEHVHSGEKYLIQEGLQDIRYSSYRSDFAAGVCQFEIPSVLHDHEKGLWRMSVSAVETSRRSLNYRLWNNTCLFYLGGNESQSKAQLKNRTETKIEVRTTSDSATIDCVQNSYYPLTLCYLVTFDGLNFAAEEQIKAGRCSFDVSPGNWTCGFNGPTEQDKDFVQEFEVIKYDKEIIDAKVIVKGDKSVTVECHYFNKEPINVCMVLSPSGRVYRPPTDQFKSKEFSYFADGSFKTGNCGVAFEEGFQVESGPWDCSIGKVNGEVLIARIFHEPKEANKIQGSSD